MLGNTNLPFPPGCGSVVPVCVRLLKNADFTDIPFKEKLFHFAIKHVPVDQIDGLLDIYHQLPTYLDARKRKLTTADLGEAGATNLKILKIASSHEIMDLEDTIGNTDALPELYLWLVGRAISQTNTHVDKVERLQGVLARALDQPSADVKVIANKISDILQGSWSTSFLFFLWTIVQHCIIIEEYNIVKVVIT